MRDLQGKQALVTGSAQGIGLQIAKRLGEAGAHLVLTDINRAKLDEAAEELRGLGYEAAAFEMDVTDYESVTAARDKILREAGPIHILVNNAGVVFGGSFLDVDMSKHELTYKVNTMGVAAVCHAFLPGMIEQEQAHLVNIASASGLVGLPFGATYASSKWSVIGLSESLRLELKHLGKEHVKVTTVCPSYVKTGMFEGVRAPMLTPFLTPEQLADKVYEAVRDDQIFVLEPFMVKLIPFLKGVFPTFVTDVLSDMLGASSSMTSWKGHQKKAAHRPQLRAVPKQVS